jgi:hypothetical protein
MRVDTDADTVHLRLPRALLADYASRLPCREGLQGEQGGFGLSFEVDVRDSMRVRGPRRRERGA